MPRRAEVAVIPHGVHGAEGLLVAARRAKRSKCARLALCQRVPVADGWASRVGKMFRDGVLAELEARPDAGELTAAEWAVLDSVYFSATGLALAYAYLGKKGWIDEDAGDFRPVIGTAIRLQRMIQDSLGRLGIDRRQVVDVFAALYAQASVSGVPAPDTSQRASGANATRLEAAGATETANLLPGE